MPKPLIIDNQFLKDKKLFENLSFRPFPGLASPYLQMIAASIAPCGSSPPSLTRLIPLDANDLIACVVATPDAWKPEDPTYVLVHGLGGNSDSGYMNRLTRKFTSSGIRTIRINLRGCGKGEGYSSLPYNGGNSSDIKKALEMIKNDSPHSPITLIGFSLGGNIVLKMAAEIKEEAIPLISQILAVCPAFDLRDTEKRIGSKSHWLFHRYYLSHLLQQSKAWIGTKRIQSIYEYDEMITAPLWGYANAEDYYTKSSSIHMLDAIQVPCSILLSKDDPFVDYRLLENKPVSKAITVYLTPAGSHMGFIGYPVFFGMDALIMNILAKNTGQVLT